MLIGVGFSGVIVGVRTSIGLMVGVSVAVFVGVAVTTTIIVCGVAVDV